MKIDLFEIKKEEKEEKEEHGTVKDCVVNHHSKNHKEDFEKSKIPKLLKSLGINDKNIAMNELGKVQLVGRLKEKLGDDFLNNSTVLDILSEYDEIINKYKDEKNKSLNSMISKGERTLAALFGK